MAEGILVGVQDETNVHAPTARSEQCFDDVAVRYSKHRDRDGIAFHRPIDMLQHRLQGGSFRQGLDSGYLARSDITLIDALLTRIGRLCWRECADTAYPTRELRDRQLTVE